MTALNSDFSNALDHVYLPFARVDKDRREIETTLFTTARVRGDKWNLKYNTLQRSSKRYMELPCVREMHQPRAAGKAVSVNFDDATQTATMVLRVVDDAAWEKVLQGVYRGVSIGGVPIITRGTDIEEFDWIETSLVDRPKDPGALFTVARAEDAMAAVHTIELPADASDEDLAIARGEVEEQLERLESGGEVETQLDDLEFPGEDDVARFDNAQPRDEGGMWTIVAGHRISVSGKSIDHNDIHAAKAKFGLSDETTGALLAAHKSGEISTDHHLFRTLSHSEAKAGGLHALTSSHIQDGIDHHGAGGSHENIWHSAAHGQAPKLAPGVGIGHAVGVHELQKGDTVHFPAHGDHPAVAGVVHKVNPKTIDIGSTVGAAQTGVRVKKEHLQRPGFVRRDGGAHPIMHHVEVARVEGSETESTQVEDNDQDFGEQVRYQAEAIHAVLSRVEEGDQEEAINQVAERLQALLRGEADSAVELIERAEGRSGYKTQPRDDIGRWTDGAGKLSVSHVHDVMRHEGIHEDHHHAAVKAKIESGELKTREDVLKHIDAVHAARKADDKPKTSQKTSEKPGKTADDKAKKDPKSPEKTGKSDDDRSDEDKPKAKPKWHETLRKLAKDTVHAFMGGYRKGKSLGRAAGDESDEIPALVEKFFDGLDDADDATLAAALSSAIAILAGEEPVQRVMESGDVPARENLEGGAERVSDKAKAGRAALDELRDMLYDSEWDGDKEKLRQILHSVLDGIERGEGDVSRAATLLLNDGVQRLDVQRMESLESELSTVRDEAQAGIARAEIAEGNVSRLEGENQQLRDMPDTNRAMQFGSVPLVRSFAANDVLSPQTDAQVQRAALETEFKQIQLDMHKEPDPARREKFGDRLIVVQQELEQLRRLA